MNKYKKWATGGVAVSIVGILVGCGNANITTGGTASAPANTVTNSTRNATANLTTNAATDTATENTITPTANSTSSSGSPATNNVGVQHPLQRMSIGGIGIGLSQPQVVAAYGEPTTKTILHGIGIPEWIYNNKGLTIAFSFPSKKVWMVEVGKGFGGSTTRGIRIGSSKQSVEKAYPDFQINSEPNNSSLIIDTKSPNGKYSMQFAISHGIVSGITLNSLD